MKSHYDAKYFERQKRCGAFGGVANLFLFESHIFPSDTVLEFGGGGGYLLKNLNCSRRLNVDINPSARKQAEENGVECYADLEEIPSASVDVVISNHALEHTFSPLEILTRIHEKLRPGGKLVLIVPCEGKPIAYVPADDNQHLYTWNPMLLGNLVALAGFKVVHSAPVYHKWPPYYFHIQKLFGWKGYYFVARCYGLLHYRNCQIKAVASNCNCPTTNLEKSDLALARDRMGVQEIQ